MPGSCPSYDGLSSPLRRVFAVIPETYGWRPTARSYVPSGAMLTEAPAARTA
jgi:hypothetical protein